MEVEEEMAGGYNTYRRQLSIFAKGLMSGVSTHCSLRDLRKGLNFPATIFEDYY